MKKKWIPVLFAVAVLTDVTLYAQPKANKTTTYFPPPNTWEQKDPLVLNMDPYKLQEAVKWALDHESKASRDLKEAHYLSAFGREPFGFPAGPLKERGAATGLIIKNGYVVAKWGDPDRTDQTFSVAKSFLSSVAGLAFDSGQIPSIDQKVYASMAPVIPYRNYDPGYNMAEEMKRSDVIELFATEHNRKITWDHLLRQTSDWEGTLWGKPDWADRPSANSPEWLSRKRNEPGTVYKYNDTRVNVLALALLNIFRKPLPVVLKEKIMDPIGASHTWRWTGYNNSWVVMDGQLIQSVSGGSHWGGGMFINTWDQARFGYLTLHNGKWKDQQILSERWLKMARTPGQVNATYGFMNFFLNTGKKLYPSAPETAFTHIGAGTNLIYVDQQNNLLIIARWIEDRAIDELIRRVIGSIGKSEK